MGFRQSLAESGSDGNKSVGIVWVWVRYCMGLGYVYGIVQAWATVEILYTSNGGK